MRPVPSVNFKCLVQAFTAGLLALFVTGLSAQTWPSKPVRVIVPFPPGGASDALARTVAQKMSEQLGQPFLIDNKPGAASTIGIAEAAKTPADGYTILLAAAPYVITQYVYPKLSYDVRKDFVPLGLLQTTPTLLVVNPALGVNTMADFLKLSKSKPGQISYATPGGGSLPHLIGELFKQQAGIDLMHVPYKGGGPALADLLAGHVNSSFLSPIEVNAHTKSGKLIALGASSLKRTPALAALPTFAEAGVTDFEALAWFGFVGRQGTPPEVLAKLSEHLQRALKSPEIHDKIAQSGDVPAGTVQEFAELLSREHGRWERTVKVANIKPE
ncbi:MAG: tripartite tricarboxylate transporter substrate binding protein [Betaproteobacteria bacterium]|nr:tripartite tricarboxylate transporter substrate binding protein [Betaproteobacteria bacterium]